MTAPAMLDRLDAAQPAGPRDEDLVGLARAGDARALRALYDRWRPAVHRVARSFVGLDRDDAEDVVQEAFVRGFGALAKLQDPARFGPWLLAIARNRALSRLARRRTTAELGEELARQSDAAEQIAPAPDPGLEAELDAVRRVIAELPPGPEKETVRLFYVEGDLTAREIADRLGVGKSTITMRLERFRTKVKRRLLAEVARIRGEESST